MHTNAGKRLTVASCDEEADKRDATEINEKSAIYKVASILEDPRQELLYDIEPEGTNVKNEKCPEINMSIEGVKVNALIDTGSEITCISEDFYNMNIKHFENKPTLPISGKVIKGATGLKSARIKKQTLLKTSIGQADVKLIFIIVPKLIRDCILGYDTLKNLKMLIDTVQEDILFEADGDDYKVNYTTASLDPETYDSMHMQYAVDEVICEPQEKKPPRY